MPMTGSKVLSRLDLSQINPDALKVRPGDAKLGMTTPSDYGLGVPDTYGERQVEYMRGKRQVRRYYGPIKLSQLKYIAAPGRRWRRRLPTRREEAWPEAQSRANKIVAAHEDYKAARHRPEYASGAVAEIEDELDTYQEKLRPVADAIAATRAVTLDGLLVKSRAIRWL